MTFNYGDPPPGGPYGPGGSLGPNPAEKRWWSRIYTNQSSVSGGDRLRLGFIGCEQFEITFRFLERNPSTGVWVQSQVVSSWRVHPLNTCSPLALTQEAQTGQNAIQAKLYGSMPPGTAAGTGTTDVVMPSDENEAAFATADSRPSLVRATPDAHTRLLMLADICPMGSGPCGCGDGPPRLCGHPDRPAEVRRPECLTCRARADWESGTDFGRC